MENASKALIIAGAILISILLISVGIMVMNATTGVQDEMESQMDSTQKQTFNAQFTSYQGTGMSASQVKSLYNLVVSSNSSHDTSAQVEMKINNSAVTASAIAGLSSTITYTIAMEYDSSTGLISSINVTY